MALHGSHFQPWIHQNRTPTRRKDRTNEYKWWKPLKILKLRIILKKNSDQPFPIQKLPSLWNIFQSLAAPARHRCLPSSETREARKLQGTLEDFISEPWTKIRALTMNALFLQPFQKWKWDQWLVTHRSPFLFLAHFFLLWRSGLKFLRKAILPTLLTSINRPQPAELLEFAFIAGCYENARFPQNCIYCWGEMWRVCTFTQLGHPFLPASSSKTSWVLKWQIDR